MAKGRTVQENKLLNIAGSIASLGPAGLSYGDQVTTVVPPAPSTAVFTVGSRPFRVAQVPGGFAVNCQTVNPGHNITEGGTIVFYGTLGLAIGSKTITLSLLPSAMLNAAGQAITPAPSGYADPPPRLGYNPLRHPHLAQPIPKHHRLFHNLALHLFNSSELNPRTRRLNTDRASWRQIPRR